MEYGIVDSIYMKRFLFDQTQKDKFHSYKYISYVDQWFSQGLKINCVNIWSLVLPCSDKMTDNEVLKDKFYPIMFVSIR